MNQKLYLKHAAAIAAVLTCSAAAVQAEPGFGQNGCGSLPGYGALKSALDAATATETSGLNNQMWATIVDRDGVVCAVAKSQYRKCVQPGCFF
jgi:hypothetical protein